jgi:hypothetical protein
VRSLVFYGILMKLVQASNLKHFETLNPHYFSFTEAAFMLPRGLSYFPVGLDDVPEVDVAFA